MRFRNSTKKPPYLNRRDQRRLLYLFGLLVLVLVGMRMAANPKTWNWMFAGQSQSKQTVDAKEDSQGEQPKPDRPPARLKSDEFRATTSSKKEGAKTPATKAAPQAAKKQKAAGGSSVRLSHDLFPAKMDDRELGITEDEWEAYKAVLKHVQQVADTDLQRDARENVSFTRLRQTPDALRGAVITIEGRLGSLRKIPAGKVDHGLGPLYEAWIVTAESDNEPYRVVFSELPAGLEPTELFDPPPDVRATGYFFKVQKYEAKPNGEEYRYNHAPLLLAKRIERLDATNSQVGGFELAPYVIGFALVVGLVLAFAMWRFTRGDKQFSKEHLQRFEEQSHEEATDLNRHEAGESPEEFFARLSQEGESSEK